ncbi:hypothetical protein BWQ96_07028 [Gracilariopsis chorda]|uniref:Bacterial toxin 47 domain-containing protein n=1 Tax=Gracilariopsis chorda TaxID=448386 RepID=A0A2V3IME7_9FLOR|nr:hypothetical protein BWQ96_07028 [Gracilariopsis chorda]|eukprot:PXF43255.1 hypothetical protein BWQ96_07028 [Gracilariopsis chorda]
MLARIVLSFLTVLIFAISAHANDYAVTIGADNGVTTRYQIVVRSCQDSSCGTQTITGRTGRSTKVLAKYITGDIRSITFQLLNDKDPAANGKDVNLIIRDVTIEGISVFPSALVDQGVIRVQCIRTRDGSIVSSCPRSYRGTDAYVIPWNDVLYKFDQLYTVSQHVDHRHRHLGFFGWGVPDKRCGTITDYSGSYCINKANELAVTAPLYSYPESGNGAGLDYPRGNFYFESGKDIDWRGTNVDYRKALKFAMEDTGIASYRFQKNQVCPDPKYKSVVVDWKGPNGASVNMDIPTKNNVGGSGPLAPHIGVTYTKWIDGKKNKTTRHIFIDSVPYTRVKLDTDRKNAPKPITLTPKECVLNYDPHDETRMIIV